MADAPARSMPIANNGESGNFLAAFTAAVARRRLYEPTMYETYRSIVPNREQFYSMHEGQRRDEHLYESGTQAAAFNFANKMQSIMVPQFRTWAGLSAGPAFAALPYEAKLQARVQLEQIRDMFFAHLHTSNFDSEITPSFLDCGVGTGALLFQPGDSDQIFNFQSTPQTEIYLEEGPYGTIAGVFRRYKMQARNIQPTWSDCEIPEKLNAVVKNTPYQEIELIEGVRYDPKANPRRPWCYQVCEPTERKFIVTRRYRTNPWIVFRWMRLAGELYGRGPFQVALPDVRVLNKVLEFILQNAAMAIAGVYMVQSGAVMNPKKLKFQPGMMIPVMPSGGMHKAIERVDNNGNFDVGQMIVKDMKASINEHMMGDPMGSLADPVRSATEMSYRQQNYADKIGSTFGRIHRELIMPLVARGLDIMDQKNLIDLNGMRVNGQEISVSVESPIAEAQNMEEAMRIDRAMKTILGTVGMQGLSVSTKVEDYGTYIHELFKTPAKLLRTEDERRNMQTNFEQMLQGSEGNSQGTAGLARAAMTGVGEGQ